MSQHILEQASAALGVRLVHSGDLALIGQAPRRALLVSRGARNPTPDTSWLAHTIAATAHLHAKGEILVSTAGRVAGDVALWSCAKTNGRTIVVLDKAPKTEDGLADILPPRHLLIWPEHNAKRRSKKENLLCRDLLLGWLADCAYAIYVRQSGNMARVVSLLNERRCAVENWGRVELYSAKIGRKGKVKDSGQFEELAGWKPALQDYLTHFTREPDGAWLGESRSAYLQWLCSGTPFSPRDAFATLCRILDERRLRACGRLMPGNSPMICFTELPPLAVKSLRRWRSGLVRWSFTPYGLAIRKQCIQRLGGKPVRYVPPEALKNVSASERSFIQPMNSGAEDWSAEAEWRIPGDVDLASISTDEMLAWVETPEQAAYISKMFGIAAGTCLPGV